MANSGSASVNVYRSGSYQLLEVIPFEGWVQDLELITLGRDDGHQSLMAVSDADHARIEFVDLDSHQSVKRVQLPLNYRIASCALAE